MANDVRLILPVVLLLAGCVGTLRIPAPETAPRLKVLWSLDLHREIPVNKLYGKQEFSSPVLADRRLVVATSTGEVHDLNPFNPFRLFRGHCIGLGLVDGAIWMMSRRIDRI